MTTGKAAHLESPLRCGIVGHGKVAELYARLLEDVPQAVAVAVCGRDLSRAKTFAELHGLQAFYDIAAMVESERISVVIVATPHPSHADVAVAAMRAGTHVLVEKPMATTVADCDRMIAAASETGVTLGVVSQRRFYEPVQRLKQVIESGGIGRPALATLTLLGWRDSAYYDSDPWRGTWSGEGGGVLINQAVHHLDLLQWLFGPIDEVFGYWGNINHPEIEVDDTAVAVLRGPDGRMGSIVVSNSQRPGLFARIHVHGDNGASVGVQTDGGQMFIAGVSEIVDPPFTDLWTIPGEEHLLADLQERDRAAFGMQDPILHYHGLQLEDFLNAVLEDRDPLVTGVDGRSAVELFEAIYRASATGIAQRTSDLP
ncbi:MAG: Gfo/Idh/MocA family oxidoreductase [Acidimicrobiia bacterium]|nr:MAG: Gfo/Idh/MocA family oxidoreductase [Acidimicrobiia bacterium]